MIKAICIIAAVLGALLGMGVFIAVLAFVGELFLAVVLSVPVLTLVFGGGCFIGLAGVFLWIVFSAIWLVAEPIYRKLYEHFTKK